MLAAELGQIWDRLSSSLVDQIEAGIISPRRDFGNTAQNHILATLPKVAFWRSTHNKILEVFPEMIFWQRIWIKDNIKGSSQNPPELEGT